MNFHEDEVEKVSTDLNTAIRKFPWMDFEINTFVNNVLVIKGGIDLLAAPDIVISFSDVFFMSLPFAWTTETKEDVFFLVEGKEAKEKNIYFQVEQGNHIFKFIPENYPNGFACYLAARSIEFELLKKQ